MLNINSYLYFIQFFISFIGSKRYMGVIWEYDHKISHIINRLLIFKMRSIEFYKMKNDNCKLKLVKNIFKFRLCPSKLFLDPPPL